jgi:chromosome segregation protein
MYLKHLTLHGYKTFANKTEFLFDQGVTAIVGPNGSGKSNVADSIRWVLGEQSYSDLRVKKTEEMIFSGSAARPRLGMAEVYLTLENLDALEIETGANVVQVEEKDTHADPVAELLLSNPSEVTLGRRAYRDGQNEYFLNHARVRLRDIHELLARWGLARNTYAVVSQGLIDQALSLRPEERRALFEEAAGIGLYQSKRQNALEKLEETQRNILRVNDIINEIAPRLPSLARQAERARNYDGVVNALDDKLRTWYAFQWSRAQQTAQEAATREKNARESLAARRRQVQEHAGRLSGLRRKGQELRAKLAEGRRTRSTIESGHAASSRELAVLDERIRFAEQRRDELATEITSLQESMRAREDRLAQAAQDLQKKQAERDALLARVRETEAAFAERQAQAAQTHSRESWMDQARALIQRLANLRSELRLPENALRQLSELIDEAEQLLRIESDEARRVDTLEHLHSQLSELKTALAVAERDISSAGAPQESARNDSLQLDAQIQARMNRTKTLANEIVELNAQRAALQSRHDESTHALAEIDKEVTPADTELLDAEKMQVELEEKESELREQLVEFEGNHNQTILDVERARAEIARLETEIEDDLGSGRIVTAAAPAPQELPEGENTQIEANIALDPNEPMQLRFMIGQELVAIPVVSAIHEGLEKEIRKLRNQLKYMGAVNPNAPQEYDELKTRHAFLTEQAEDARRAIDSLHKAIAELDEIMHRKFQDTFQAINVEFGKFFPVLFNGGTARLELTEPEDLTQTGIDIIAKPPGKRAAHLAMLSGGERALTAAALLFAILKVSPTPFCVMDEVDAMLDEANVGRFRDALKSLTAGTQFIVITHNRLTMESADAVYGITMGDDGVSQAISLRLNGTEKGVKQEAKSKKRKAAKSKQ